MSTRARKRDHAAPGDYGRRLRDMNDALLVSSVQQHELTEHAERAAASLRRSEKKLRASNEGLELRVAERTAALTAYQQRLRGLVKQLGSAEIRERKRIAVELHDNLAQMLAVCKMKVSAIEAAAPVGSQTARDALAIKQLLGQGIDYTRTLMSDLRPEVLNEYDLTAAIQWVGRRMERFGLAVSVEDDGRPKPLQEELLVLIFDSTRELLFNVIKHAAISRATVSLRRSVGEVRVTVSDAGAGFDPRPQLAASSESRGFGLFSIAERLSLLGGRMEVMSIPGHGTDVSLIVPVRSQRKAVAAPAKRDRRRSVGRVKKKEPA